MTMELPSRQELNKLVKSVLVRHFVDVSILQWSCTTNTAHLYGDLRKFTGQQFTMQEIDTMVRELSRLPHLRTIRFNLSNWDIGTAGDSWNIRPKAEEKWGHGMPDKVLVQKKVP